MASGRRACVCGMLVVHSDASDENPAAGIPPAPPVAREAQAAFCKEETYSLCMEMDSILKGYNNNDDAAISLDKEMLQAWFSRLKSANKSISRYVRSVVSERDRAEIESHMLKHAMISDVLDREATFTQTLSVLAASDGGGHHDRVARALRFVASVNGNVSSLAPEGAHETLLTEACVALRDDGSSAA